MAAMLIVSPEDLGLKSSEHLPKFEKEASLVRIVWGKDTSFRICDVSNH
jgi:hypothetical protein